MCIGGEGGKNTPMGVNNIFTVNETGRGWQTSKKTMMGIYNTKSWFTKEIGLLNRHMENV